MGYDKLYTPTKVGKITLKHKIVMSAMTRLRNDPETEAPREINKVYYSQRTSDGGLIISEGVQGVSTPIGKRRFYAKFVTSGRIFSGPDGVSLVGGSAPSAGGRGYIRAPGVHTDAHIDGWKIVTKEVHSKGGYIFCQLMHGGKISHSSLLPDGKLPVAPSAIAPPGQVHIANFKKVPYETPRALETDEVSGVVAEFAKAAKAAIDAGFDGIEIHGGNGYIIQQFLSKEWNTRTDKYGGSVENRSRFVLEIVDATVEAIGADKVGIKLQQGVTFSGLVEPEDDSKEQLAYLGPELEKRNLAFVCLSSLNYEPYYAFNGLKEANFKLDIWRYFRKYYKGTLMINGGLSPEKAEEYVADGTADLVAFGVLFLANANLPELLQEGEKLNDGGWATKIWYGHSPDDDVKGYTDWPLVSKIAATAQSTAAKVSDTATSLKNAVI